MRRTATNIRNTYGGYRPRHIETDEAQAEQDATAGRAAALAADLPARIVHPVVPAPSRLCFRVIRRYLQQGHLELEDIGSGATLAEALRISTRERWRAQVLDPNGRMVSDNFQDMERR